MPQLFQVLKCFRCSVFQVHQTKKSNKWECKLCSKKQSIKRHYGLGTGKECRLHVQKLNSIRGEIDRINEMVKLNEDSDEEVPEEDDASIPNNKQTNYQSKWSEFEDKSEDVDVPEPESMYIGNAEVVLEVPAKRRKFAIPKATKNSSVATTYASNTENFVKLPIHNESQISNVQNNFPVTNIVKTVSKQLKVTSKQIEFKESIKTAVLHKVDISSKWALFVDKEGNESCGDDTSLPISNDEDGFITNESCEICKHEIKENKSHEIPKNIFSLCDDNDLDDVLDF